MNKITPNTKSSVDWRTVNFKISQADTKNLPVYKSSHGKPLFEVALAGRSNVGKSSLLNTLWGRKKLAKTAQAPGKTRLLNFFVIDDFMTFVDLPGYGYAKVSNSEKDKWGDIVESYLINRPYLKLILFLLDIRHPPTDQDLQFLKWAEHMGKDLVYVFTKVDKISNNQREKQIKEVLSYLPPGRDFILFSSKTNEGCNELRQEIIQKKGNN